MLRRAAAEAACAYGLDPCAGASCRPGSLPGGSSTGGFVAVHWRAEGSLAFTVPGGLELCARLLGQAP